MSIDPMSLFRKYSIVIIVGVLVVVLGAYYLFVKENTPPDTVVVSKRDLKSVVSFAGSVEPARRVSLSFQSSGRVGKVYVDVGDTVKEGQKLAILSNAEAIASLAQARASYEAEKANLNDILKGTRPEKVAVNQAQVDSATSNLNSSQSSLRDALESTYSKADDVVHNTLDPLFDNDVSPSGGYNISPRLVYSPINVQLKSSIESKRAQLEKSLYDWKSQSDLGYVNITNSNILMAENTLSDISSLLNDITQSFVNSDKPSSISQATFDSWKSSVSLARSNISSASSLMSSADEKLSSAKTALAVAQNELSLSKAGATSDAILSERAKLTAAEAKVSQLEAQLSNTYIISPIDGVVASRNVDPGETVSISGASGSSASPAFTVISKSKFEIKANVSELDVGRLKIGNHADIVLDAFGPNEHFDASLSRIDPGETIVGNSPAYGVVLQFVDDKGKVLSGMTANAKIVSEEKDGVLAIPASVIKHRDGKEYVDVYMGDEGTKEFEIVTGIEGTDSFIEVISGVKEGDRILVPTV